MYGCFVTSAYSALVFVCPSVHSNVGKLVNVVGCISRSLLTERYEFETVASLRA